MQHLNLFKSEYMKFNVTTKNLFLELSLYNVYEKAATHQFSYIWYYKGMLKFRYL